MTSKWRAETFGTGSSSRRQVTVGIELHTASTAFPAYRTTRTKVVLKNHAFQNKSVKKALFPLGTTTITCMYVCMHYFFSVTTCHSPLATYLKQSINPRMNTRTMVLYKYYNIVIVVIVVTIDRINIQKKSTKRNNRTWTGKERTCRRNKINVHENNGTVAAPKDP
jgi:hypothetical protein